MTTRSILLGIGGGFAWAATVIGGASARSGCDAATGADTGYSRQRYADAVSYLLQHEPPHQWRPIETAPHDGTIIEIRVSRHSSEGRRRETGSAREWRGAEGRRPTLKDGDVNSAREWRGAEGRRPIPPTPITTVRVFER
jgi:hypothetical protein